MKIRVSYKCFCCTVRSVRFHAREFFNDKKDSMSDVRWRLVYSAISFIGFKYCCLTKNKKFIRLKTTCSSTGAHELKHLEESRINFSLDKKIIVIFSERLQFIWKTIVFWNMFSFISNVSILRIFHPSSDEKCHLSSRRDCIQFSLLMLSATSRRGILSHWFWWVHEEILFVLLITLKIQAKRASYR